MVISLSNLNDTIPKSEIYIDLNIFLNLVDFGNPPKTLKSA
jgi:hypothetical protein